MTVQDIMVVLGGIGTLLSLLAGAAKWILTYIDGKAKDALEGEKKARSELKQYLDQEIQALHQQLREANKLSDLYMKRILQLEAFIRGQKGQQMPTMEGWPPK